MATLLSPRNCGTCTAFAPTGEDFGIRVGICQYAPPAYVGPQPPELELGWELFAQPRVREDSGCSRHSPSTGEKG
jgi:hypothetical protein